MKFLELCLEYLSKKSGDIKRRTALHYAKLAEQIFNEKIMLGELENLTESDFEHNLRSKYFSGEISYSTERMAQSLANRCLRYGYEQGMLSSCIKIELAIKNNRIKFVEALSRQEQEKLENHILGSRRYYSYGVLLSLYTGLRIGELLSLRWENVDFEHKQIKVVSTCCKVLDNHKLILIEDLPKTASSLRVVPINGVVIKLLRELRKYQDCGSEFVISGRSGKRIDMRSYQESFSRLLRKLNIRHYGFHSLRHTFATRCLENGVDIKTISEILGHANPTITLNRYVHTSFEQKVAAIDQITKKISQKIG